MAFASSIRKGQIPVNCNLCEEDPRIQFKCKDCDMLLCRNCKEKKHIKFKNAADHKVIDIKEIGMMDEYFRFSDVKCQDHEGQPCCVFCKTCNKLVCLKCMTKAHNRHDFIDEEEHFKLDEVKCENHKGLSCCMFCKTCNKLICLKCLPRIHNGHDFIDEETFNTNNKKSVSEEKKIVTTSVHKTDVRITEKPKLTITRRFDSDLKNIYCMAVCTDGSLWLGDHDIIKHVRLRDNDIQIISDIFTKVHGMEVTSSGDILLTVSRTSLEQISGNESGIINTKYNISPLHTRGIHVTSDNKVIIGAKSPGPPFPRSGRRAILVMDQEGNTIKEYEYDKTNTPLFTIPIRVTSTSNGNICVIDRLDGTYRGRVVILSQGGDVISVYTGHQDINKDEPFQPRDIVTPKSNNIIITDTDNHYLHILNSSGQFITYFRLHDMGIRLPYSLAVTGLNKLYIGCVSSKTTPYTFRSKLYEMEYSGF